MAIEMSLIFPLIAWWFSMAIFVNVYQRVNHRSFKSSISRQYCSFLWLFRYIPMVYPPVNSHRPWQIGVGRLVSTKNWWFSGSMLIYQRVIIYHDLPFYMALGLIHQSSYHNKFRALYWLCTVLIIYEHIRWYSHDINNHITINYYQLYTSYNIISTFK